MTDFMTKYFWWLPFGSVPELGPEELARIVNKRTRKAPQLLDVRTAQEWNQGHIKNTLNVPIGALKGQIKALPFDKSRPVYAICRSAHRSIPAVRLLQLAGYRDVQQLRGGMSAWEQRGFPVLTSR
ncbi:MAG TPA: rhodanese-like domain-containing protein [Rhizobiales bacterium]|nr:rhodanese-like domain-containing protein [Hyphomicrobiales bacterium]